MVLTLRFKYSAASGDVIISFIRIAPFRTLYSIYNFVFTTYVTTFQFSQLGCVTRVIELKTAQNDRKRKITQGSGSAFELILW